MEFDFNISFLQKFSTVYVVVVTEGTFHAVTSAPIVDPNLELLLSLRLSGMENHIKL